MNFEEKVIFYPRHHHHHQSVVGPFIFKYVLGHCCENVI